MQCSRFCQRNKKTADLAESSLLASLNSFRTLDSGLSTFHSNAMAPPCLIVMHPRERRSKCTVRPLRGLPGFEFRRYPLREAIPQGYVRLGLGGPLLSDADAGRGLLVLDGTWRWASKMEAQLAHVP